MLSYVYKHFCFWIQVLVSYTPGSWNLSTLYQLISSYRRRKAINKYSENYKKLHLLKAITNPCPYFIDTLVNPSLNIGIGL